MSQSAGGQPAPGLGSIVRRMLAAMVSPFGVIPLALVVLIVLSAVLWLLAPWYVGAHLLLHSAGVL